VLAKNKIKKSIIFEEIKKIGVITLNRQEVLNAWNKEMRLEICEIFKKIKKDKSSYYNWFRKKSFLCRSGFK
jgi:enoyl-CoA hydratase/carnithine racemase